MNLKKILLSEIGQSVLEYTILFAIMISALVVSGFIARTGNIFSNHFNAMQSRILGGG